MFAKRWFFKPPPKSTVLDLMPSSGKLKITVVGKPCCPPCETMKWILKKHKDKVSKSYFQYNFEI